MPCRLVIVTPPLIKPSEPGLSGAAAAERLRAHGLWATSIDASLGWFSEALAPGALGRVLASATSRIGDADGLAFRRAIRSMAACPAPLRQPATYVRRDRYSSAVAHLENALRVASLPWNDVHLRVGDVEVEGLRLETTAALAALAHRASPFDAYYRDSLIPRLRELRATHVGISLTFQNQLWGAFRLAALLREAAPELPRLLAGPLVACWRAAGAPLRGEPFSWFQWLAAGDDKELAALAAELAASPPPKPGEGLGAAASIPGAASGEHRGPLSVDLEAAAWDRYLVPEPTVPAALGRGCSWRRCTFCPDHLHARHRPCEVEALDPWLRAVATKFPRGATLHLTDSALPLPHLERLAETIRRGRLPLRWHGFVRIEPTLASADFARHLAAGGCTMLQLGVESGSARLCELMGKGASPALARGVLRNLHTAGIRNQVYLLFGLPTETEADREQTLELVEQEVETLHDLNAALLNLPRGSPMHRRPDRFGITAIAPFHDACDLSLYDDFRCGDSHPRVEARRWLDHRFAKNPAVRRIVGSMRAPFKASHACFLPPPLALG